MRVDLKPLEPNVPGQARLIVIGWEGEKQSLEFSIQRNQDQHYLHSQAVWRNTPHWFQVSAFTPFEEQHMATTVAAELLDPLLAGGAAAYRLQLRQQGSEDAEMAGVRVARGLLPSIASGSTQSTVSASPMNPAPLPEPPLPVEPSPPADPVIVADPPVLPPRAVEPPHTPKSRRWLVPVAVAIAVLLALLVWFLVFRQAPAVEAPMAPPPAVQATPSAAAPDSCAITSLGTLGELAFVQLCAQENPGTETVLAIIAAARQGGQCGVAQRLYANRAHAGDVQVGVAYAREYDPKFHQPSDCFPQADAATALYWYETVLAKVPDHAEAAARVKELTP
jgi:hypothetical protein